MFNKRYSKIILASLLVFGFCLIVKAQDKAIDLQVPIPGQEGAGKDLASYIAAWYTFGLGAISVVAVVMIMWGGLQWLTAAGSGSQIGEARKAISNAVVGLILALCSYGLLYIINPNLVKLKLPEIGIIQDKCSLLGKEKCEPEPGCQWVDDKCIYIKEYVQSKKTGQECGFLGREACLGQYNWGCWWTGNKCEVLRMCGLTRNEIENKIPPVDSKIVCCSDALVSWSSKLERCGFFGINACELQPGCQLIDNECVPQLEYKYTLLPLKGECRDICGVGWTLATDNMCKENLGY
ncbi:MAG: Uncharacterized protein Athens071412_197 [Parcubacteria group bacterium Athens0714_12]|nr:MAG: Uncharacterized protein Athens071412_197 [Parcubacteria group bacterium Athens0714_12]